MAEYAIGSIIKQPEFIASIEGRLAAAEAPLEDPTDFGPSVIDVRTDLLFARIGKITVQPPLSPEQDDAYERRLKVLDQLFYTRVALGSERSRAVLAESELRTKEALREIDKSMYGSGFNLRRRFGLPKW